MSTISLLILGQNNTFFALWILVHLSIPMWPVWIFSNMTFLKHFGITILVPLNTYHLKQRVHLYDSKILQSENDINFYFLANLIILQTNNWHWLSISVATVISLSFLSLTGRLDMTIWTCASMPSDKPGYVSSKNFLENVLATEISRPGLCVTWRSYRCNTRPPRWWNG